MGVICNLWSEKARTLSMMGKTRKYGKQRSRGHEDEGRAGGHEIEKEGER